MPLQCLDTSKCSIQLKTRNRLVWVLPKALVFLLLLGRTAFALQIPDNSLRNDIAAQAERGPSDAQLSRAITLSGNYLVRACLPDGRFVYRIDTESGRESRSYNIVRHAGAIYALSMLNASHPNPQLVSIMVRAANFMTANFVGEGTRPGTQVVWSRPLPSPSDANLGATGLGLVALIAVRRVAPQSVSLEQLRGLGRFLIFLQNRDGSFINKYRPGVGAVQDSDVLYYPGEAALGLLSLYDLDPSPEWLTASDKALSYLAAKRANLTDVPPDHWALLATAKLLPYCENNACAASRDKLIRHAEQICRSILVEQHQNGSFDYFGKTTPTATRMEGLLASLEFLQNGPLREEVISAVRRGIIFLVSAQITSGWYAGGIPGAVFAPSRETTNVRIDYVQHSLSAWLQYQQSHP